MSAERKPQESPTFIERPLLGLTRLVLRFPLLTLVLGGLLALGATVLSNTHLGFRTNRLDLLNPKSQFNQLWLEYIHEFGDQQDVLIVVEGPGPKEVLAAREDLASAVRRENDLYHSILAGVDASKLQSKGLYYLPVEQLQQIEGFVQQTQATLHGGWAGLNVGAISWSMTQGMQAGMQNPAGAAESQAALGRFLDALNASLAGKYQSPWPEMAMAGQSREQAAAGQMLANGGRMGFILLKLAKVENSPDFVLASRHIDTLHRLIAEARSRHPQTKIGLTGLPVIEHDEMLSSKLSMAQVSLVSLLGVSLLFVAGFGGWRHPLLAVASLTLGMAWSMGYITLAIGHLNILSSAFGVILIGQGIDFSMYYVAQYLQLRKTMPSPRDALVETVRTVGPGVATGAMTTAVAFFMAGLTEFTGVAELGIVAGGGILLCWLAGLTLLPAMICIIDTKFPSKHSPALLDVRGWLDPLLARPRVLLAVTSCLTILIATGMGRLWYDHNLLHLQASGLESVDLERRLLEECDQNASFALSIADSPEELLARKAQFLALPSVKQVEEIASRFPNDVEPKRVTIERLNRLLADVPQRAPVIPSSRPGELAPLITAIEELPDAGPAGQLRRKAQQLATQLQSMDGADSYARLADFQQRMAADLLARLRALKAVSNPEPPQLTDLPKSLVDRFVSPNGRHLLKIYSKGDIWDMTAMEQFVREVRSVDARATGNPLQVYEASLQMKRSYEEAALYALAIILPVLFLDFLTIRHTLLALLPLGLGMLSMFGLMGLLNIPLNPANMIVLPLILGIGIDAGVHVVHDYCSQRGPYRINASTASAVVINSVTNMAGFGALMIASHRGLQSLGRVLTLGLTCCLFASLIMLPAILSLMSRRRRGGADDLDLESDDAGPPLQRIYRLDRPQPAPTTAPASTVAARRAVECR